MSVFSVSSSLRRSIPEILVVDADAYISTNICRLIFDTIKKCIVEYCSVGSMGGLYYLTVHGAFHRLLWLIVLVSSIIACYFATAGLFEAREILILNEQSTISTFDIPFPAVTVCTTVKADHRVFDYSEISIAAAFGTANEEESILNHLVNVVLFNKLDLNRPGGAGTHRLLPDEIDDVERRIYDIGIKQDDLIASCSIDKKPCKWSRILTKDGLCYTFNLIGSQDMFNNDTHAQYKSTGNQAKGWTLENGYENRFDTNVYPQRGVAVNKDNELKLKLQLNHNDLVNSLEKINGFPIYVGHPIDYPDNNENRIFVPINVRYTLNVSPEMILSDEAVKHYPLKVRQCYIKPHEWNHKSSFKKYSLNNCELECISETAFDMIQCIQFYIPRLNQTRSCGSQLRDSVASFKHGLQNLLEREAMYMQMMNFDEMRCNCFPPCSSLTYNVREVMTGVVPVLNSSAFYFSDVTVRFSSSEFIPKRRQESCSTLDVLSAIGGTLGLFVGASVISIIELFYFFSIKIALSLLDVLSRISFD